jgi:hypothetical protein
VDRGDPAGISFVVTISTGVVSSGVSPSAAGAENVRPCCAMSAARSPSVASGGSRRTVNPELGAWHHMQSHGSPFRCSEPTWLTIPHAEQRRKT